IRSSARNSGVAARCAPASPGTSTARRCSVSSTRWTAAAFRSSACWPPEEEPVKLLRFGPPGKEKPGLVDAAGRVRDLSAHVDDIDLRTLDDAALDALRRIDPATLPEAPKDVRIGPCVAHIGKLVCVGLNYSDHAAESNMPVPTEPILFLKPSSAVCGPGDNVEIARGLSKTDWEVELGVVIGRRAKYVDESRALEHVAGYCVVNDVSEREFQFERQGQWDKGNGHDSF